MKIKELYPRDNCILDVGEIWTDTLGHRMLICIYEDNGKEQRLILDRKQVRELRDAFNNFLEMK